MDTRRLVLWVIFGLSLMFIYDAWQKSNGQPGFMAPKPAVNAPTAKPSADPAAAGVPVAGNSNITATVNKGTAADNKAVAAIPSERIIIKNDVLVLTLDTAGGNVVASELTQHLDGQDKTKKMHLLEDVGGRRYTAESGLAAANAQAVPNHTARTVYTVLKRSETSVTLSAETEGVQLIKTYTLQPKRYDIAVKFEVKNNTAQAFAPELYTQLLRHGEGDTPDSKASAYNVSGSTFTGAAVYSEEKKFEKIEYTDVEKGKAKFNKLAKEKEPAWAAMVQHYFVTAWVPQTSKARDLYVDRIERSKGVEGGNWYTVGIKQSLGLIAAGGTATLEAALYIGPQDQDALEKVATGLDLVVDYGMLTIIAKPMFAALQFFHALVGNWGWAIVLLTVSVKAILFWPMAMSYRSMAKMKTVAPKMKELQERHKDDKAKLNQAMMEMYRTEKINPLSGCLPIFFTIPVFISLYWVLLASVEIRHAPWIFWITDLSSPDQWYVLPVLLGITMYLQFKLSPTPPDPMQAKMMMIMQAVFAIMFLFFPAGLNLYYFVNNLLSIAQQWVITRGIEQSEAKAAAKLRN